MNTLLSPFNEYEYNFFVDWIISSNEVHSSFDGIVRFYSGPQEFTYFVPTQTSSGGGTAVVLSSTTTVAMAREVGDGGVGMVAGRARLTPQGTGASQAVSGQLMDVTAAEDFAIRLERPTRPLLLLLDAVVLLLVVVEVVVVVVDDFVPSVPPPSESK